LEVGLTRYVLEVGRTVCILRFIALFAFYSEFCVQAFDEGNAGDLQYTAPAGLIGDYPLVDAFSLGQLAERRDMLVDNGPCPNWGGLGRGHRPAGEGGVPASPERAAGPLEKERVVRGALHVPGNQGHSVPARR